MLKIKLLLLWVRVLIVWCAIFHRRYHVRYWQHYDRDFIRCNLCDCKWSRPRS